MPYRTKLKLFIKNSSTYRTIVLLKKNEEAIDFFDQVIKINPKYISALSSKGIALMHLNKNEDALVCMKKAIDLDPNNSNVFKQKGNILWNLKNVKINIYLIL